MKPGQRLTQWWQDLVAGRLRTPQSIVRAAISELPPDGATDRFLADQIPDLEGFHAPKTLQAPQHFYSNGLLNQWEKADFQYTDYRLQYWASLFQELARKRGIPLYVHSAFRTRAEQEAIYKRGNSRARWPSSAHNIGEAVDIVHGTLHWSMNKQEWAFLHRLGQEALRRVNTRLKAPGAVDKHGKPLPQRLIKLELEWGGEWSYYDPAHWQIAGFKTRLRPIQPGPSIRSTPRAILRAGLFQLDETGLVDLGEIIRK